MIVLNGSQLGNDRRNDHTKIHIIIIEISPDTLFGCYTSNSFLSPFFPQTTKLARKHSFTCTSDYVCRYVN